jgi:hypothetical protein
MAPKDVGLRLGGRLQRMLATALFRRPIGMRNTMPMISFTFDDFPRSALQNGGMILRNYGVVGTYYAALGIMGKHAQSGSLFVREDLSNLLAQGHELGCHSFGHCDSWSTRPRIFEQSIYENKRALEKIMPGTKFNSFSYPISYPFPLTKRIVSQHFESCRCGGQRYNAGVADLGLLGAFFLERCGNDLGAVMNIIARNCADKGWLIFATHDVCENPSNLGCSIKFYSAVVEQAMKSGAEILSVSKALKRLRDCNVGSYIQ